MRLITDGTTLSLSVDSLEGGVITVTNTGGTTLSPDIEIHLEDFSEVNIPHTTAFTYNNITLSQGSTSLPSTTLDWAVGSLAPQASATINFDIAIVDASVIPHQFRVKAVNTTADDDTTNDIAVRTFNVLNCDDITQCNFTENGIFSAANNTLDAAVSVIGIPAASDLGFVFGDNASTFSVTGATAGNSITVSESGAADPVLTFATDAPSTSSITLIGTDFTILGPDTGNIELGSSGNGISIRSLNTDRQIQFPAYGTGTTITGTPAYGMFMASAGEILQEDITTSEFFTKKIHIPIVASDIAHAVADGRSGYVIPASMNGYIVTNVVVASHTSGTGGTTDVQIRRRRAGVDADMLTTPVTLANTEQFAQDGVIDAANDDVATGDIIYADVDAIQTGSPAGLDVVIELNKE